MSSRTNPTPLPSHSNSRADTFRGQHDHRGGHTFCSANERLPAPTQTQRNLSEPLDLFVPIPVPTIQSGARPNDIADIIRRTYGRYLFVLGKPIPATQGIIVDLRLRLMPNGILRGETEDSTLIKLIEMFESLHLKYRTTQGPLHHWDLFTAELENLTILSVLSSVQRSNGDTTADLRGMLPLLQGMKLIPELAQKKDERCHAVCTPPPQILQMSPSLGAKQSREDWTHLADLARQIKVCRDFGGITDNLASTTFGCPSRSVCASALVGVFLDKVLREWLVLKSRGTPMPLEFLLDNYPRTNLLSQRPVHKPFPLLAADFKRFAGALGSSILSTQTVMSPNSDKPLSKKSPEHLTSIWNLCNQSTQPNLIYIGIPWSILDDLARSTLKLESTHTIKPPHPQNDEGPWGEARRLAYSLGRDDPHKDFHKAFPADALALAHLVAAKNSKVESFVLAACTEVFLSAEELNFRGWKPSHDTLCESCCVSFNILSLGNVGECTSGWQVFGVPLPNCILVTHGTSHDQQRETKSRRLFLSSCFSGCSPILDLKLFHAREMEGASTLEREESEPPAQFTYSGECPSPLKATKRAKSLSDLKKWPR